MTENIEKPEIENLDEITMSIVAKMQTLGHPTLQCMKTANKPQLRTQASRALKAELDSTLKPFLKGMAPDFDIICRLDGDPPKESNVTLTGNCGWFVSTAGSRRYFSNTGKEVLNNSLALIINGKPVIAVCDFPAKGETLFTCGGHAYIDFYTPGSAEPARHSDPLLSRPFDPEAFTLAGTSNELFYQNRYGYPHHRAQAIGLEKMRLFASGNADCFIFTGTFLELAPIDLITQQIGGKIMGDRRIDYTYPLLGVGGLVGTTEALDYLNTRPRPHPSARSNSQPPGTPFNPLPG